MENDVQKDAAITAKSQLECEKLKAEIEVIRKPFYRSATFYAAISPVLLAVLGLIFSWQSGWFDVQRTRINNEKLLVQVQTERLERERVDLESQKVREQARIASLTADLQALKADKTSLANQISSLKSERDEMRSAKEFFENEAKRLAGSDTNALKLITDLQAAQVERRTFVLQIESLKSQTNSLAESVKKREELLKRLRDYSTEGINLTLAGKKLSESLYLSYIQKITTLAFDSMLFDGTEWRMEPDPVSSTNGPTVKIQKDAPR